MKTPAVTMVAAWISAETGVGPSMASGSQVWSGNCADLPIAPMNSSRQTTVIARCLSSDVAEEVEHGLAVARLRPTEDGALAKIVSRSIEPNSTKTPKMPSAKPKSPTRLTTKALIAAALADGRLYQKPISR